MIRFLLPAMLSLSPLVCLSQPIREWTFDNPQDIHKVAFLSSKENQFVRKCPGTEKTPDGQNTLELIIETVAADAHAHSKQVNFYTDGNLKGTAKYQIEFWIKSSMDGELEFNASQAGSPYKPLAKGASKRIAVNGRWQKVSLEFMPSEDWQCKIAVPRLLPGKFPVGSKIYLGPVSFSLTTRIIPFALNKRWQVFPHVIPGMDISDIQSVPSSLHGVGGDIAVRNIIQDNGCVDVAAVAGGFREKAVAWVFNEFESPDAGMMQIGIAADWWMEVFINGVKAYDTLLDGNVSHRFRPEDHIVNLPVIKGRNLLAVKVISGSNGWKLVADKVPYHEKPNQLIIINPGADWKAIDMTRLNVQSGTALDFSLLSGSRPPAGSYGRVIVNPDGRLAFEKKPDEALRFLGFSTWAAGRLVRWERKDIKEYAEAIARQGYNIVRIQAVDLIMIGDEKRWSWRDKMKPFDMALRQETLDVDPDSVDKLDYFLSCLKAAGVYFNLDLMSAPLGMCLSHPKDVPGGERMRTQLLFNPIHRRHWEIAVTTLLKRRNPYTGICLKDDPALVCVEPFNEQDILLFDPAITKVLTMHFQKYLGDKYKNDETLRLAWGRDDVSLNNIPELNAKLLRQGDAMSEDAGTFLIATMTETTDWYYTVLRRLGYPGLISQWDMIMRTMELPVRAKMPVIAQHSYFAHPNPAPSQGRVAKSKNNALFGWDAMKSDIVVNPDSSLNSSYFRAAAAIRFLDRPFLMTEYSHSAFNRYRHERGLYFGAYSALQGWDSLCCHGHPVFAPYWQGRPFMDFENAIDPISRASEVVIALAWARGDVSTAPHSIQFDLSEKDMFPRNFLAAVDDDYAKLAMLTRIGIALPAVTPLMPVGKVKADLNIPLNKFTEMKTTQWYVQASNSDGQLFPSMLRQIREKGIIPPGNRTDYSRRLFQSETGEITLDGREETMTVVTPRLEGAIVKKDTPVKLRALEILSCSSPASIAIASLDHKKALDESGSILLVFATNALNQGMIFDNHNLSRMLEVGSSPVLMKTARLSLKLNNKRKEIPAVYALNMDGTRAEPLPVKKTDDGLMLSIDTAKLKHATPFFEVAYP